MYKADLTFMINDDEGGSLAGLAGMLGQFGLGMGGGESNLDKILELSKARIITQKALFEKAEIDGQNDYLANHLISSLKQEKKWASKGLLSFGDDDELSLTDFSFTNDSFPTFSLKENKALKKLHSHIIGKEKMGGAFTSDYSEVSGIMEFSMMTSNQELSIMIVDQLFDKLSDYYVDKTASKQRADFNLIKSKYDSIQTRLNSVQYSLAKFEDEYQGLIRKQDQLRRKQLQGEELKLATMVGEVEKQYQIASLTLENKTAYIQLIDKPIAPLKPANKGAFFYLLLGGLLGGLLSVGFLIAKKTYRDIMAS